MKKLCPECLSPDLVQTQQGIYQCEDCGHACSTDELVDDPGDDGIDEDDLPEDYYQDPDLGGTGHGDISFSDADPGL